MSEDSAPAVAVERRPRVAAARRTDRIYALDLLRFGAALMVVLYHLIAEDHSPNLDRTAAPVLVR